MLRKQLKMLREKRDELRRKYNQNPDDEENRIELKLINRIIMREERNGYK